MPSRQLSKLLCRKRTDVLKQDDPVFLLACVLQHFLKIKLYVTKPSPPEFEESSPEALFELYFRCQLSIKPVSSDPGEPDWLVVPWILLVLLKTGVAFSFSGIKTLVVLLQQGEISKGCYMSAALLCGSLQLWNPGK